MLPRLVAAFRSGEGVPWSDYGEVMIKAQGDFNRPWLKASLGTEYLPAIPDVHSRLRASDARVADLACGAGWAAIAIASAYPNVTVDGFDVDEYSIEMAAKNAADAGLTGRVSFHTQDVGELAPDHTYDLAVVVEAVHDLSRPVEFLAAVRRLLAPGGVALVVDEKAGEAFTAPADELDRAPRLAAARRTFPVPTQERPTCGTTRTGTTSRAAAR